MNESSVERLIDIKKGIHDISKNACRNPSDVTLIAVSKTFETPAINPLLESGHRIFGENRVQEAYNKWPTLKTMYSDIELHLIGPLQMNKVRQAVRLFDVIHTLDSVKLAERIAQISAEEHKKPQIFIQINTGEEPQKTGVLPQDAIDFAKYCTENFLLQIVGFMCIPPINQESYLHFSLLKNLAEKTGLSLLSMGMSADYEDAIFLGATHIRLGRAIFGSR